MTIKQRVAKLEAQARGARLPERSPGVTADVMAEIKRVAGIVETPEKLEAFLRTLEGDEDADVVSIDRRRSADAARSAFARTIFEEVRSN